MPRAGVDCGLPDCLTFAFAAGFGDGLVADEVPAFAAVDCLVPGAVLPAPLAAARVAAGSLGDEATACAAGISAGVVAGAGRCVNDASTARATRSGTTR